MRMLKRVIALCLTLLLALAVYPAASAGTDLDPARQKTLNWLGEQSPTGSLAGALAYYSIGASEIPAVSEADPLIAAITALMRQTDPHKANPDLFSYLLSLQKSDGSYGTLRETLDTALLITCLLPPSRIKSEKTQVYLELLQESTGALPGEDESEILRNTAAACLVFSSPHQLTKALKYCAGADYSSVSAEALCYVMLAFTENGIDLSDVTNELLSRQRKDGSFGDPILSGIEPTYYAVIALSAAIGGHTALSRLPKVYFRDWSDISPDKEKLIIEAAKLGLANGDTYGDFMPKRAVTRAEAATVLRGYITGNTSKTQDLPDLKPSAWYYESASRMLSAGVISAANGLFLPSKTITRADLALILTRLLDLDGQTALRSASFKALADVGNLSEKTREAVAAVVAEGLVPSDGNLFEPDKAVTREELIAIAVNIMK